MPLLPPVTELPPLPKRPCIVAPVPYRGGTRPTAVDSIVSDTHPIRVHYDRVDDADRAALVLEYAELSWRVQVDELGFRAPVLPDGPNGGVDGPEFDIYLTPVGQLEAWSWAPDMVDDTDGDGLSGAYSYIAIDRDMPDAWVPSYTAHEFQHATQWATDFTEPTFPIWEGTANAAQEWTLRGVKAETYWDYDVYSFQEVPWAPSLVGDGTTAWETAEAGWTFEYGTALWVMTLDESLGAGDGTGAVDLWRATANEGSSLEPDVADAVVEVSGMSLGAFMNEVARNRWLTGARWDDRGLADAESWGSDELLAADHSVTTATLPVQMDFERGPMITGQAFVDLTHDASDQWVKISVVSPSGLVSAVTALSYGRGAKLQESADGIDPEIVVPLENVGSLAVAVTNLGTPGWDGDDEAWVAGDQILTIEFTDAPTNALPEAEAPRACGCRSTGGAVWLAPLGLLALRRRRRRRPSAAC